VSLIVDNRTTLAGEPALHALIIGVSEYPHLIGGSAPVADHWHMGQLTSTASTAAMIADWLQHPTTKLPRPLGTLRLLLSPSATEGHLAGLAAPATLANVIAEAVDWRRDASAHRDGHTFFYFAGHGIQRTKEDAVFCLHDFRQPPFGALHNTIDLATLHGGMSPAPGRDDIARTQFYFVDACRVQPKEEQNFAPRNTSAVFDRDLAGQDDRRSPVFYSSISNTAANAVPGRQTLFSMALLECLQGAGADSLGEDEGGNDIWGVSVNSLDRAMKLKIDELNREHQADQTYTQGGQFTDAPLCILPAPPLVDVELSIDPVAARLVGALLIKNSDNSTSLQQPPPVTPHPFKRQLPAGLYSIEVSFTQQPPPFATFMRLKKAQAPRVSWKVTVV
jgi:hypothetical protein